MYCIECGTKIDADRIKCLKCGANQSFFFSGKEDDKFNKRNLSGGVVGYNANNSKAKLLAERCYNYAKVKECIAPSGSNRSNHRQDQALLTVLAYKFNMVKGMPKKYYGFDVHRDID